MRVKYLIDEDFINYKEPSMFIGTISCSGKCYKDLGLSCSICQNHELAEDNHVIDIPDSTIIERYLDNDISKAIVFGGLEPFDQYEEVKSIIDKLRNQYNCNDMVVIYTGYNEDEVQDKILDILFNNYKNIIIKYGRYIPNREKKYDATLGVYLASDNQHAERIS